MSPAHGTLVCRGTPFANHWCRLFEWHRNFVFLKFYSFSFNRKIKTNQSEKGLRWNFNVREDVFIFFVFLKKSCEKNAVYYLTLAVFFAICSSNYFSSISVLIFFQYFLMIKICCFIFSSSTQKKIVYTHVHGTLINDVTQF